MQIQSERCTSKAGISSSVVRANSI